MGICTARSCNELHVVVTVPRGNAGSLPSLALLLSNKCQTCSGGFTQNSFSWHLTDVPGASPAATAVPDCTGATGAQTLCSAEQLLHPSSSAALSCSATAQGPALHHCYLLTAQAQKVHSLVSFSTSSAQLLHPRATCGHQTSGFTHPSALGHPQTTGSFSN